MADVDSIVNRLHTTHTQASAPKFPGERRLVIPSLPVGLKEPPFPASTSGSGEISAPQRPSYVDSPRREFRNRDFHSTGALSCLRGGDIPDVLAATTASSRRTDSPARSANSSVAAVAASAAASVAMPVAEEQSARATGVHMSGKGNAHCKNIIFPNEAPSAGEVRGALWCRKALPNGSHVMLQKRHIVPQADRTSSPAHGGKKILERQDNIVGCSVTVTKEEKRPVFHRNEAFHPETVPYLTSAAAEQPAGFQRQLATVGLMGYGPTGRRRISVEGAAGNLIEHRDEGWNDAMPLGKEKLGVIPVAGHSYVSHVPWELGRYTAEELNERPFRPSSVHLEGPPPFVPAPMTTRTSSHGRMRVDDRSSTSSKIFPIGGVPSVGPNPHTNSPLRVGRAVGRYSPLRQRPPSSVRA